MRTSGYGNFSYAKRITKLNLTTLELRKVWPYDVLQKFYYRKVGI